MNVFESQVINKIFIKTKIKAAEGYLLFTVFFKSKQVTFDVAINGERCLTDLALLTFYVFVKLLIDFQFFSLFDNYLFNCLFYFANNSGDIQFRRKGIFYKNTFVW